ncbi:MAG: hypothetical protein J6A41_00990 [Ruminiclostridium sp.]|nr:hypothetical protein [Ruminiclostridium sp.]
MKIPEKEKRNVELAASAKAAESSKKETTARKTNLSQLRKNAKNRKTLLKLLAVLAFLILFAAVWMNADTIFEPLRGIASKIETRTSTSVGFPVSLPGSAGYSFEKFGENFSLLTDTYLYTYRTTGEQIYALRHGYSNPSQITTDRRILLYDKASYSFALYNKTSLIYEKTVEDKILFGALSNDDMAVIVTNSPRYSNILYVYDSGGNWKYTKKFADENVMQVAFTEDGEHIIVSTISVDSGEIVTSLYKYSIRSDEGYKWKYSFRGNSMPCGLYADLYKVTCICDNSAVMVSCSDGSLINEYNFGGNLRDFVISSDFTAIYYNDASTNLNTIVSLDGALNPVATVNAGANAQKILLSNDIVYVLDGMQIKTFSGTLLESTDSIALSEDCSDFIKIADSVYLLGYDTVNTERIN